MSGGWATPQTEVSGSFDLSWWSVDSAEATRLPGTSPASGAETRSTLSEGRRVLEGEFLGSVKGLSQALDASSHAGGRRRRRS